MYLLVSSPFQSRPEIVLIFLSASFPVLYPISSTTDTVLANVTKDLLIGKIRKHFSALTLFDLTEVFDI